MPQLARSEVDLHATDLIQWKGFFFFLLYKNSIQHECALAIFFHLEREREIEIYIQ